MSGSILSEATRLASYRQWAVGQAIKALTPGQAPPVVTPDEVITFATALLVYVNPPAA